MLGGAIIAEKIVGNREKVVFLHSSCRAFVRRLRKIENLENVKIGSGNLSFGMFSCCPNLEKIDVDLSELVSEIDTIVDIAALDSACPLAKELLSCVGDVVLE